jgi:hypothetical protein
MFRNGPRAAFAVSLVILTAAGGPARPDPPAPGASADADRNAARWDEWDAQARITEGDYDGAVQAARQADADRQQADRQEAERKQQDSADGAARRP